MKQQDIRAAIDEEKEVIYEGLVYTISACIYRRITNPYNGQRNSIIQVELYRGNNSVIIADPRKVEIKVGFVATKPATTYSSVSKADSFPT